MPLRIENAVDLHCHYGPDHIGGTLSPHHHRHSVTAIDAAKEALASGHAAILLKSHSFASPVLAHTVETLVPGLQCFGGICMDYPSGGLHAGAAETALALGAKIVWLPTVNSTTDHARKRVNTAGPGISILDDQGRLLPVVHEIAEMVRKMDAVLATGHTTAAEHYAVVRAFAKTGKVLLTHAGEHLAGPALSAEQCAELAGLGAMVELTALTCQTVRDIPGKSPLEISRYIECVGPERCTLSSDYGWSDALPRPAPGLWDFLEQLWSIGVPERDLQRMASTNPARLLGVTPR